MRAMLSVFSILLPVLALAQAEPVTNPPPEQSFAGYSSYELRALTVASEYANNETAEKVRVKVDENLKASLAPVLAGWQELSKGSDKPSALVVEPHIKEVRFIGGAKRFWAGGFAGNSHVTMVLKITDAQTGKVIAEPAFYQRANAVAGAWTFGAHDNAMLSRVVDLAVNYMRANYEAAVGGATGRDKG
jgi:hypothetical protein